MFSDTVEHVFFPIGRGGQRIRELEDASGARIKVHIAYLALYPDSFS